MSTVIFNALMEDAQIERAVLVEFGFGHVNKKKVVEWAKGEYPTQYALAKREALAQSDTNVIEFTSRESEMMTADERTQFLESVMKKL